MHAASSSTSDHGGLRFFSGETEDNKEYKRWKNWVLAKMLTLDKMPKEAKGAYVFTLLSGKALECVEHLEPSAYQKEGGEKVLFDLLDQRFPQKEVTDEMSESLTEIFNLKAADGESLKAWISRASELFDRCARKTNVIFPDEARGWLILHRSGLNEEQKAVVLARSLGVMKREEIGKAMRSCYPEYVVSKKRTPAGVALLEEDEPPPESADMDDFNDIEQFLAEYQGEEDINESFEEPDVAEALAVSWRDKRQELSKLQKARNFGRANEVKRSFRVEVEELKKKTKCHRCGQLGHWSRECRAGGAKGKGKNKSKSQESGAAAVEATGDEDTFFVAMAAQTSAPSPLDLLRSKRLVMQAPCCMDVQETLLVSSPGFGVIDSGCGKTIIGRETLEDFKQMWSQMGINCPSVELETNHFKFGNGQRETSSEVIPMPVRIAGRSGVIRAAIVQGRAPLLISRSALQKLKATLNFHEGTLTLFGDAITIPLQTNTAGQFTLNVLSASEPSGRREVQFNEVLTMQQCSDQSSVDPNLEHAGDALDSPEPKHEPIAQEHSCIGHSASEECGNLDLSVWSREDSHLTLTPITGKSCPFWHRVHRRVIHDLDTGSVISDETIDHHSKDKRTYLRPMPKGVVRVRTDFHFSPQELTSAIECLPVQVARQLRSQIRTAPKEAGTMVDGKRFLVAEVFSPPRFAPVATSLGFSARSYDLKQGCDLSQSQQRHEVQQFLADHPPDLLVLCPPCTYEGGWFNLNACTMHPEEYLRKKRLSRLFVRFCCELFEQ